jgi:hypothetical protein
LRCRHDPSHRPGGAGAPGSVLPRVRHRARPQITSGCALYWMIPAVLASLVGGVINAWLVLVKVPA